MGESEFSLRISENHSPSAERQSVPFHFESYPARELDQPDLQIDGVAGKVNVVQALSELCTNQPPLEPEPIYLCTTNREAQTMNAVKKSQLSGENMIFKSVITGKFMERDYPTPAILELKLGARVMVLNNKRTPDGNFEYVNGEVGVIEKMAQDHIPTVQVLLDNGRHVTIQSAQWNNMEYELEKDQISGKEIIRQKVVGTFIQLPLKLAYAITVHKAQETQMP